MRFLNTKQVYLELGISCTNFYYRLKKGYYPPLESGGNRLNGKGYSEITFNQIKDISISSVGRPRKIFSISLI